MSKGTHTEGPWDYRQSFSKGEPTGYVITPQGYDLSTSNEETTEADARLIAAAPELFEALKLLNDVRGTVSFYDGWATLEDGTEIFLGELIAKAGGQRT